MLSALLRFHYIVLSMFFYSTATMAQSSASHFEAIAIDPGGIYHNSLEIVSVPSDHQISRFIIPTSSFAYRAKGICIVKATGFLGKCSFSDLWPKSINKEILYKHIISSVRISYKDTEALISSGQSVFISIFLNDENRELNSECPPDWCPIYIRPPSSIRQAQ